MRTRSIYSNATTPPTKAQRNRLDDVSPKNLGTKSLTRTWKQRLSYTNNGACAPYRAMSTIPLSLSFSYNYADHFFVVRTLSSDFTSSGRKTSRWADDQSNRNATKTCAPGQSTLYQFQYLQTSISPSVPESKKCDSLKRSL